MTEEFNLNEKKKTYEQLKIRFRKKKYLKYFHKNYNIFKDF